MWNENIFLSNLMLLGKIDKVKIWKCWEKAFTQCKRLVVNLNEATRFVCYNDPSIYAGGSVAYWEGLSCLTSPGWSSRQRRTPSSSKVKVDNPIPRIVPLTDDMKGKWQTIKENTACYLMRAVKLLLDQLHLFKLDIITVQVLKWTGNGVLEKKNHTMLYSFHTN